MMVCRDIAPSGPAGEPGPDDPTAGGPVGPEVMAAIERNLALTSAQRLRQFENKMRLRGLAHRASWRAVNRVLWFRRSDPSGTTRRCDTNGRGFAVPGHIRL